MRELINSDCADRGFRCRLLSTVSAFAILLVIVQADVAEADENDKQPTVWIELGVQLERGDGGQAPFAPSFFDAAAQNGFVSPLEFERSARFSNGFEGSISFMPRWSDWVFSGSLRYGRSEGRKFSHQQHAAQVIHYTLGSHHKYQTAPAAYVETKADNSETHLIADFQAGKDVGLGVFGERSESTVSFGIRLAQFATKSGVTIRARPDVDQALVPLGKYEVPATAFHEYFSTAQRNSNFRGIGPSISWKASAPLTGNNQDGEVALDWGINAAALFGRQKVNTQHKTSGMHYLRGPASHLTAQTLHRSIGGDRSHSLVVPNVGGFAGLSFLYDQAKVSLGYRADFFFGAVDGGLDSSKSYDRDFYGPFASITIGLGG